MHRITKHITFSIGNKTTKLFQMLLVLLFTTVLSVKSQSYSISGYITDKSSRETLIGATVQIKGEVKAAITDKNGHYSLTGIKPGKYKLLYSHIGYATIETEIIVKNKGIVLDEVQLKLSPLKLDEVSIIAVKPDDVADKSIETSHIGLTPQMIKSIPTASNDVFSAIKFLPGIDRTETFSPLYTVRGGDPGENAVLLDGVTIYNPYHSSVTSGIFNALTIKNVDMLVGGFGAEFGGRNSSVMYITTKDGNPNELHGEIRPSTFSSRLFLEFPAGKNASMMIAGRYMYDVPFNFLFHNETYFYDFNISYTNRINNRNRITLKYFESKDYTGFDFNTFYVYLDNTFNLDLYKDFYLQQRNDWINRSATAIHKLIISPRIYMRNQVYYSYHKSNNFSGIDFQLAVTEEEGSSDTTYLQWASNSKLGSKIADFGAKSSLTFKLASFTELHIGAEYNNYEFSNGIYLNDVDNGNFSRYPALVSAFAEQKFTTSYFSLRPGIRISNYRNGGWMYEPRINASINLPGSIRLKAAYGEYLQYIISMNTNEIEMNQIVDYYYPLWDKEPSKSVHYILGVEKKINPSLKLSVDAYYKEIKRTYTFDINQKAIEAFGFTNKLQQGIGDAYGIEVLLLGKMGKVSGWMSYAYSKSHRQYPESGINDGEEFAFDYNRPHTLKTVLSYQITPNFALNTSFLFLSGAKRSIETTVQSYFIYDPTSNTSTYFPMFTNDIKNNAKMPPLIHMDLSIEKKLINGFGKKLADFLHADESYVTVTIRDISFLYRNIMLYIPGMGLPGYYDKYLPLGTNYLPKVGASYTLKF